MAARTTFFLLCDAHAESGGKHNLIGIFEQVNTLSFPTALAKCYAVAHIKADPGEHSARLRYTSATTGEDLIPPLEMPKLAVGADAIEPGAYIVCEFQGLPVPKEGFYSFRLEVDGAEIADCGFTAILRRAGK